MLRDAETTSIAETKAYKEKMPSGRRNDATRTMMSRTMPCNVSACSLNTADKKGFCFNNDPLSPKRKLFKKRCRAVDEMMPLER